MEQAGPALEQERMQVRTELLLRAGEPGSGLLVMQPLIARLQRLWQRPTTVEQLAGLLAGNWRLLYTSTSALSSSGLDALPGIRRGDTYQCIDAATSRVWNLAQLQTVFGAMLSVLVRARFSAETETRVRVHFEQTAVVWGAFADFGGWNAAVQRIDAGEGLGLRLGLSSSGTLDTLYADAELRIGLGNRGTIFILARA